MSPRQPKPPMTEAEHMETLGMGVSAAAQHISEGRYKGVKTETLRKERRVSKEWVRQQRRARQEIALGKKPIAASKKQVAARNGLDMDKRGTERQTMPTGGIEVAPMHLFRALVARVEALEAQACTGNAIAPTTNPTPRKEARGANGSVSDSEVGA